MALKLSIFTTVTRPEHRGDNWRDALACYKELADEVIVISGSNPLGQFTDGNMTSIYYRWPHEFDWPFIGQQFQRGYEAATGDWVIHADLDFIFHEKDFQRIREAIERYPDAPALSFYKHQFILPDRYNLKSRLVLAVNKGKYGDRIRFDSGGDLCQPSLDGRELKPDDVPASEVAFYNYERMTKTEEQIREDAGRMDRAYKRHFGRSLYSAGDQEPGTGMMAMMVGRFNKPQQMVPLGHHPKYVRKTIENLRPDQWGYSGFGMLPVNNYVEGA